MLVCFLERFGFEEGSASVNLHCRFRSPLEWGDGHRRLQHGESAGFATFLLGFCFHECTSAPSKRAHRNTISESPRPCVFPCPGSAESPRKSRSRSPRALRPRFPGTLRIQSLGDREVHFLDPSVVFPSLWFRQKTKLLAIVETSDTDASASTMAADQSQDCTAQQGDNAPNAHEDGQPMSGERGAATSSQPQGAIVQATPPQGKGNNNSERGEGVNAQEGASFDAPRCSRPT